MKYYKHTENGYILYIGTGLGQTQITAEEYSRILSAIENRPDAVEDADCRLREDLTWELVK